MNISYLSKCVRYTGRWAERKNDVTTTTPGAILEVAFSGNWCELRFEVGVNVEPYPHLYIQLDGGIKTDARLDHYIRVETPDEGNHVVTVYFKSAVQSQQRWYEPLEAKVSFVGAEADGEGVLPEDNRKIIEFVGDSITEGIWVDQHKLPYGGTSGNYMNMVFQNDSTATYAYLTAKALDMKPCIMGYGSVGLTKGGGGGVPKGIDAYPYCFHDVPFKGGEAEIVVVNYGANDLRSEEKDYIGEYRTFLEQLRNINPSAHIVVLGAFLGVHAKALDEMICSYNAERNENILYIDTTGWIPRKPIHPTREGHRIIAEKLVGHLEKAFNL